MTSVGNCVFVLAAFIQAVSLGQPRKNCVIKEIKNFVNYVENTVNSSNLLISDTYTKNQASLELLTEEFQAYMLEVYNRHVLQIQLAQQNAMGNGRDLSQCNVDQNIVQMQSSLNVMYYEFTSCTKGIEIVSTDHVEHSKAQLELEVVNVRELQKQAATIEEISSWEVLKAELSREKVRIPKEIKDIKNSTIEELNSMHDQFLGCEECGMDRVATGLDSRHNAVMSCLYSV